MASTHSWKAVTSISSSPRAVLSAAVASTWSRTAAAWPAFSWLEAAADW
ncbi:MAG: hypothetical protein ACRD0A_17425 [Acidimicrobiales bacterium]